MFAAPRSERLDAVVVALRDDAALAKVEEHPEDPHIILTEPGIGYRIAES